MHLCESCGLLPAPRPINCGLLVFVHFPKTGGTTVAQHLRNHNVSGGKAWSTVTITGGTTWEAVLARVRREAPHPRLIAIHHVGAAVAFTDPVLQERVIRPLEHELRGSGCRLMRTTLLREPSSRAASAAFYHRVPHEQYSAWIAEHAADSTIAFLLYNRQRRLVGNATSPMTHEDLERAQRALALFDAVGRTEELSAFLAHVDALLGWSPSPKSPSASSPAGPVPYANPTPESQKYGLTSEERLWTARHTSLDAQLLDSLCVPTASPAKDVPALERQRSPPGPRACCLDLLRERPGAESCRAVATYTETDASSSRHSGTPRGRARPT